MLKVFTLAGLSLINLFVGNESYITFKNDTSM